MKKTLLYIFFCFSVSFFSQEISLYPAERTALVSLYQSTNGEQWNIRWDFTKDSKYWYGLKIQNGHVIELRLNANNLKGNFPSGLGAFSQLKVLNLSSNNLFGNIEVVASLNGLTELDVSENNLSGDPSAYVSGLTELQNLSLGKNQFTVVDFSFLTTLRNLQKLDVANTGLQKIPSEISGLINLQILDLSGNNITTGFENLQGLSTLTELNISDNQINTLPTSLSSLINLTSLNLSKNPITNFSGLTNLKKIEWISLEDNNLNTIPTEITFLQELRHINLNYNKLTNASLLSQNKKLQQIFLNNNLFEGAFPSELLALKEIQMISLNNNNLTGAIPFEIPQITLIQNNRYKKADVEAIYKSGKNFTLLDYSPQRYDEAQTVSVALGDAVTLKQELSGTDGYQFSWFKNLDLDLHTSFESHHISRVENSDFTNFTCEAYFFEPLGESYFEMSFFREPIKLEIGSTLTSEELNTGISVYPIPTSDFLNITSNNEKIEHYSVFDLSGKLVLSGKTVPVNVKFLPSAAYIIVIKTSRKQYNYKFIKQ